MAWWTVSKIEMPNSMSLLMKDKLEELSLLKKKEKEKVEETKRKGRKSWFVMEM